MTYRGKPLKMPNDRPSQREIIETDHGHIRLLRRNADRVRIDAKEGTTVLALHFEH